MSLPCPCGIARQQSAWRRPSFRLIFRAFDRLFNPERSPQAYLRLRQPRRPSMKTLRSTIIGLTLFSAVPVAQADVVTDWSQTAIEVMKTANVAGNPWTRSMAMMHVAISDAVNTVQGRYTRFIATGPAAPGASAEAAASAAAREMLLQLYPAQKAKIDEAYALSLKSVPEGAARNSGVAVGEQVAVAAFSGRSKDANNGAHTPPPVATPRAWSPTTPPLLPQYAQTEASGVAA